MWRQAPVQGSDTVQEKRCACFSLPASTCPQQFPEPQCERADGLGRILKQSCWCWPSPVSVACSPSGRTGPGKSCTDSAGPSALPPQDRLLRSPVRCQEPLTGLHRRGVLCLWGPDPAPTRPPLGLSAGASGSPCCGHRMGAAFSGGCSWQ